LVAAASRLSLRSGFQLACRQSCKASKVPVDQTRRAVPVGYWRFAACTAWATLSRPRRRDIRSQLDRQSNSKLLRRRATRLSTRSIGIRGALALQTKSPMSSYFAWDLPATLCITRLSQAMVEQYLGSTRAIG